MPLDYCVDVILLKFTFAVTELDNILVLLKSVKTTYDVTFSQRKMRKKETTYPSSFMNITNLSIDMIAQRRTDSFSLSFFLINVCYTSKHAFFNSIQ